ncbi:MAG: RNA polymerase sigma factor [Pyrinomonadaceae bacterium]
MGDLFCTAVRLGYTRSAAEELIQGVYLHAQKSSCCRRLTANCRACLFSILFYEIKLQHRFYEIKLQHRRSSNLSGECDRRTPELSHNPTGSKQPRDAEMLAAFETLPLSDREAVLLADVQDFSIEEIAFILETQEDTVRLCLSRGRKLLREAFNRNSGTRIRNNGSGVERDEDGRSNL